MKIRGNGRAKVLKPGELNRLFAAFKKPRDRCLFAICLFTACRVSEALGLDTGDIKGGTITFRKSTTKGKLKTRSVGVHPQLEGFLQEYKPKKEGPLFPGQVGRNERLTRGSCDRILKDACKKAGLVGVSTHSFRRTALTQMSTQNVPLRTIQEISGHSDLGTLQRYLEVSEEQVQAAIRIIGF